MLQVCGKAETGYQEWDCSGGLSLPLPKGIKGMPVHCKHELWLGKPKTLRVPKLPCLIMVWHLFRGWFKEEQVWCRSSKEALCLLGTLGNLRQAMQWKRGVSEEPDNAERDFFHPPL